MLQLVLPQVSMSLSAAAGSAEVWPQRRDRPLSGPGRVPGLPDASV